MEEKKFDISDDQMKKIYGLVFLVGYIGLSIGLIIVVTGSIDLPNYAETMITMIWTGTSTKFGTMIDYFFGGVSK